MSVAEMKLEAINKISKLSGEGAVKEILQHLVQLEAVEQSIDPQKINHIFEEASVQYGNTLKKLAE
jgi:hypothetical protein